MIDFGELKNKGTIQIIFFCYNKMCKIHSKFIRKIRKIYFDFFLCQKMKGRK